MTELHHNFKSYLTQIPLSSAVQKMINHLMGSRIIDVALHFPFRMEERIYYDKIHLVPQNQLCTLVLKVSHHGTYLRQSPPPYSVFLSDGTSMMEVVYFKVRPPVLRKMYPEGQEILISGRMQHHLTKSALFGKITHPDHVGNPKDVHLWSGNRPIYPLTGGVQQPFVQRFIASILKGLQPFPEWVSPTLLAKLSFPSFDHAVRYNHTKGGIETPVLKNKSKQRLIFDEYLAHQLSLILASRRAKKKEWIHQTVEIPNLVNIFLKKLPFTLTDGQKKVIDDVVQDFQQSDPMVRLLQGDVGCGKTAVAFVCALYHIEKGGQVAFLAPTEILAQQHYINIKKLFGDHIRIDLLTGKHTAKQKREILKKLENHEIDLLIGTHALIQDTVIFKNLTFCVIDEQHRFGVEQRMALNQKGMRVDLLSMTATPIPRSLTLAQYGDMDVSTLKEKPKGRIGIKTSVMSKNKYPDLAERLKNQIEQGIQAYWVCPVIEESTQFTAAVDRFQDLKKKLGESQVGLVHGKMKGAEKEAVMQDFKDNKIKVLVATTVIEVGVDVPNASIMVIEHPERFGLAQLHQLRGRVGRGTKESFCILLYGDILSKTARLRLDTMKETDDGFKLAEMDLKMRGSGEITGTQQSGMPTFKFSNHETATMQEIDLYNDLMQEANTYAWQLLGDTVYLPKAIENLLPLFDKNITFTQSG